MNAKDGCSVREKEGRLLEGFADSTTHQLDAEDDVAEWFVYTYVIDQIGRSRQAKRTLCWLGDAVTTTTFEPPPRCCTGSGTITGTWAVAAHGRSTKISHDEAQTG